MAYPVSIAGVEYFESQRVAPGSTPYFDGPGCDLTHRLEIVKVEFWKSYLCLSGRSCEEDGRLLVTEPPLAENLLCEVRL